MKRIMTIIAAGLVGTTLLTDCKKDPAMSAQPTYAQAKNANNSVANAAATPTANPADAAQMTYNLSITPPITTELLEWTSGNMLVGLVFFNGNMECGNSMKRVHYTFTTSKPVNLFPGAAADQQSLLGNMNIPWGKYLGAELGIVLEGVNAPGPAQGSNPVLRLNGSYWKQGQKVQVQVIVDQLVELKAFAVDPLNILNTQGHYTAALEFSLKQLTAGINAGMLGNAVITNNTLVISDKVNQNLYQLIFSNLTNSLKVKLTPAPQPVNGAAEPVTNH